MESKQEPTRRHKEDRPAIASIGKVSTNGWMIDRPAIGFPNRDIDPQVQASGMLLPLTGRLAGSSHTGDTAFSSSSESIRASEFEIRHDERDRIARELHDSTSQLLVLLELQLLRLKQMDRSRRFAPMMADLKDTIAKLHEEVRQVGTDRNFDPSALRGELERMAGEFAKRAGLTIDLKVRDLPIPPTSEIARAIYRVVQEALANVQRHSGASNVHLQLRRGIGRIILLISDDGVGMPSSFPVSKAAAGKGLRNMAQRLGELGGCLTLRRLRKGTLVRAVIPFA